MDIPQHRIALVASDTEPGWPALLKSADRTEPRFLVVASDRAIPVSSAWIEAAARQVHQPEQGEAPMT